MSELYTISNIAVRLFGPFMVACFVLMYIITKSVTGKSPHPKEILYVYARYNLKKKGHAGLLTYILILCAIFFVFAVIGILVGSPTPNKP